MDKARRGVLTWRQSYAEDIHDLIEEGVIKSVEQWDITHNRWVSVYVLVEPPREGDIVIDDSPEWTLS